MTKLLSTEIQELIEGWPLALNGNDKVKLEALLKKCSVLSKYQIYAFCDSVPYPIDMISNELSPKKAAEILRKLMDISSKDEFDKYLEMQLPTDETTVALKTAVNSLHELVHDRLVRINHVSTGIFEGQVITSEWTTNKSALENAIGGQLGTPTREALKEANQLVKDGDSVRPLQTNRNSANSNRIR